MEEKQTFSGSFAAGWQVCPPPPEHIRRRIRHETAPVPLSSGWKRAGNVRKPHPKSHLWLFGLFFKIKKLNLTESKRLTNVLRGRSTADGRKHITSVCSSVI